MLARALPFVLALAATSALVAQGTRPPIYSADVKARMARALELADIDDIRVLINWGTDSSELSRRFAEAMGLPDVRKTRYDIEYHIVNVDVGKLDKNLDLAKQYAVPLKAESLPMLTVLDQHGKPIAHASARDFLSAGTTDAVDPAKVAAFLTLHRAPAPDAVAAFDSALKQAKAEGKLLFVWFSAPW